MLEILSKHQAFEKTFFKFKLPQNMVLQINNPDSVKMWPQKFLGRS